MIFLYAASVGVVVAGGIYMMLERHVVRVILGIAMIAAAANMLIFLAGRVGTVNPPIVPYGGDTLAADAANPLPQALVLTAIVIGFALVSFAIVLAFRAWQALGTLDTDAMTAAENDGTPFERRPESWTAEPILAGPGKARALASTPSAAAGAAAPSPAPAAGSVAPEARP